MSLLEKSDEEIIKIAEPVWTNLVKSSNIKDYGGFTKDFSSQMLYGANEVEIGKQWASNELRGNYYEKEHQIFIYQLDGSIYWNLFSVRCICPC